MSNNNIFKKTFSFFKKPAIFRFVQTKTLLIKSVKTIYNLNNSKTTKEQLKVEEK